MSAQDTSSNQSCYFFHFGLIVTGKAEREHLTKLFRSLMALGICTFEIITCIGQRSPITSQKQILKMVGTNQIITKNDEEDIGGPARRYLWKKPCSYVLLVDDLEHNRTEQAQQVYDRYRKALDTMLGAEKHRASVHFLVNMLEAYYFAHAEAINTVLGTSFTNYQGDVETIRNPKGDLKEELKKQSRNFNEIQDGGQILDLLEIEYVLSQPDTCASLRTLFAWCLKVLEKYPNQEYLAQSLINKYRLDDGILSIITGLQLNDVEVY